MLFLAADRMLTLPHPLPPSSLLPSQAATSAAVRAMACTLPAAAPRAVAARAVAPVRAPSAARGLARGGVRRARASFAVCAASE